MAAVETAIVEANALSMRGALLWGQKTLRRAGIENGWLDAEVLLRHTLSIERERLYVDTGALVSAAQHAQFCELVLRRSRREPLAYITGHKEFWSLDFIVTSAVLIPRPETELLVEVALQRLRQLTGKSLVKVLDLGTGSGAIAVCLAKEEPGAEIVAVDISPVALEVARVNAKRHGVTGRIQFLAGDLFAPLKLLRERFDLIVSNPPYIRSGELPLLAPEIRDWEPMSALDGGVDGLDTYRRIIREGQKYLASGGFVALEIGADMASAVTELFASCGGYGSASVHRDVAGKDRVVAATKELPPESPAEGGERG
jgi:release factor glutamine methyltransferase